MPTSRKSLIDEFVEAANAFSSDPNFNSPVSASRPINFRESSPDPLPPKDFYLGFLHSLEAHGKAQRDRLKAIEKLLASLIKAFALLECSNLQLNYSLSGLRTEICGYINEYKIRRDPFVGLNKNKFDTLLVQNDIREYRNHLRTADRSVCELSFIANRESITPRITEKDRIAFEKAELRFRVKLGFALLIALTLILCLAVPGGLVAAGAIGGIGSTLTVSGLIKATFMINLFFGATTVGVQTAKSAKKEFVLSKAKNAFYGLFGAYACSEPVPRTPLLTARNFHTPKSQTQSRIFSSSLN